MSEDKPYTVFIRPKFMELYAASPEAAKKKAEEIFLSSTSIQRFQPEYDIEVEEGWDKRKAPSPQEMYGYLLSYSAKYGWDRLFNTVRHYFSYHAFDRGEHEDWKPRPKNREQFDLIDKLSNYSRYEFDHGVDDG